MTSTTIQSFARGLSGLLLLAWLCLCPVRVASQTLTNGDQVVGGNYNICAAAGANTKTCTLLIPAYRDGMIVTVQNATANTTAATLNITGVPGALGAKNIYKLSAGSAATLASGDLAAAARYLFVYDSALNAAAGGFWRTPGEAAAAGLTDPGSNGVLTRTALNTTSVVSGSASDCVKVDGTSGACGSGGGVTPFTGDYHVFAIIPCSGIASGSFNSGPIGFALVSGSGSPPGSSCGAGAADVLMNGWTITTGGSTGNDIAARADGFQTNWLSTTKLWTVKYSFSISSTASISFIHGLATCCAQAPSSGVFVRYDTNLGDTNFLTCISNGGSTSCATDVETVGTTVHTIQWQKTLSTTITGTWDTGSVYTFDTRANGAGCTAGNKTICSATFNTSTSVNPNVYLTTRTGAAKSTVLNYWEIQKQR